MLPVPDQPRPGNLPWACVALLAIGLLVFLTVQRADPAREEALAGWYQESGLFALEWPNYISWLRINGKAELATQLQEARKQGDVVAIIGHMGRDPEFARENLQRGEQYWSSWQHRKWQQLHKQFEEKSHAVVSHHFGLVPASPRPATWLTWHFLQQSVGQWLLTLLLILPFAWPLEAELGKRRMVIVWMLSGVITGLGYVAFMNQSYQPLIGNTPLASAVIGMYLGLFATRRLPFRWFHPKEKTWRTNELPAAVLAPLWLALPVWAWYSDEASPALWLAQLIALPAGAALVHLVRRDDTEEDEEEEANAEEEAVKTFRRHLTSGWNGMSALNFREAEAEFEAVLALSPGHFHALTGLYHIRKLNAGSDAFRDTAQRVLATAVESEGDIRQQLLLFRDFQRRSELEQLPLETGVLLMMRFTRIAELRDAEQIAQMLVKRREPHPLLPKALAGLAAAYQQFNDDARANRYRSLAENLSTAS